MADARWARARAHHEGAARGRAAAAARLAWARRRRRRRRPRTSAAPQPCDGSQPPALALSLYLSRALSTRVRVRVRVRIVSVCCVCVCCAWLALALYARLAAPPLHTAHGVKARDRAPAHDRDRDGGRTGQAGRRTAARPAASPSSLRPRRRAWRTQGRAWPAAAHTVCVCVSVRERDSEKERQAPRALGTVQGEDTRSRCRHSRRNLRASSGKKRGAREHSVMPQTCAFSFRFYS